MSLRGSGTTAATPRPTDFGAPLSPVAIAGIAAAAATGAGLLLVGFAFLLAYVTLGKEKPPEDDNGLGILGASDPTAGPVAGYEPLGARNASVSGSSNDLLGRSGQSLKGAEISTPMNLDLVGFTPEPFESVTTRTPRSASARRSMDQAGYFANQFAQAREMPTPQQGQGGFFTEAPYNRAREPRSGPQDQAASAESLVRREPQRGMIQSQTSYYSDKSDPPYARLRGAGSSRYEFEDDAPDPRASARWREDAIARKQEANYYSDGRYTGRAAYDRF